MATSFETRYQKIERTPLGEGTYGEVYKVKNVVTGEILAMKRMKLQDEEEGVPSTAIREVAILKAVNHPNIVKLIDVFCTQNKLLLVFEFVDSDLKKYMRRNGSGPLTRYEAKNFVEQMLKGICFCHERRIIHRDLKPQNLLVTDSGQLKLADFGLARTYTVPMPKYTHEVVTVWYRSPEILLGQELYAVPVDLWSAGCIFAEMGCGQPLFAGDSEIDTIFNIFQKLGTPTENDWKTMYELPDMKRTFPKWRKKPWTQIRDLGNTIGPRACDLLEQIMQYDPMRRISAKQSLEHEYFKVDDTAIPADPGNVILPCNHADHAGSGGNHAGINPSGMVPAHPNGPVNPSQQQAGGVPHPNALGVPPSNCVMSKQSVPVLPNQSENCMNTGNIAAMAGGAGMGIPGVVGGRL